MACCLPTCAQGSSVPNTEEFGKVGSFWAFGFLLCVPCASWGVLVLLAIPLVVYKTRVT